MRQARTVGALALAAAITALTACTSAGASAAPDPGLPADPTAYAQVALDSWANGSQSMVTRLVTPAAANQLIELANRRPNMQWSLVGSRTTGDVVECVFRNQSGDELTVEVHQPAGGEHRLISAALASTAFPATADGYTGELVAAWQAHNGVRLLALAGANIADYLTERPPPATVAGFADTTAPGGVIAVAVHAGDVDLTVEYTSRALGRPRAVKDLIDNRAHRTVAGD